MINRVARELGLCFRAILWISCDVVAIPDFDMIAAGLVERKCPARPVEDVPARIITDQPRRVFSFVVKDVHGRPLPLVDATMRV